MVVTKKSLRSFFLLALLFFWLIAFGFFEGFLNANSSERIGGVYLVFNIALAGLLFLLFPIKLKLNFPGVTVYAVLMIWLFVIHFIQQDYLISSKKFFTILVTQCLLVTMANYAWKIDFFKLIDLVLVNLAIVLAIAIYIHITKIGPIGIGTHVEEFRMGGIFSFGVAAVLGGLGFLLSFYQVLFHPSGKKITHILLACFFLYCLVASDLRTAIGACMAAISIQYILYLKSKNKNIFPFLILASCLYGGYKLYVSLNAEGAGVERDFEYRQLIWAISSHGIFKNPIVGYGNTSLYFKKNIEVINFNELLVDPHSSYLALMLQSGVIAFLLLFAFLFRVAWFNFFSSSYYTKALVSVFVYWMIVGSTGAFIYNLDYEVTAVFFIFSILAFCCHPVHRAENKKAAVDKGMLMPVSS